MILMKSRFFFLIGSFLWFVLPVSAEGNLSELYDRLFLEVLALSAIVFALVVVLWLYMVLKFRKGKVDAVEEYPVSLHKKLQITWIAVPIFIGLLLLAMSLPALSEFQKELSTPVPDETIIVEATDNWQWKFYRGDQVYRPVTDENGISMTTLPLESGRTYKFILWSTGEKPIIHSFYVYELNFKMDVVPHKNNTITVTIKSPGSYLILCAEYCGARHSMMRGMLEVS